MGLHQQRDLSFQAPTDWSESTVAAFRSRRKDEDPEIVLLVAREPIMPNDTLEGHAGRTLLKLEKELHALEIGETRTIEVGTRRALSVRVEFEVASGRYEQTLVMVDPTLDPDGQVWVFVATAPIARRDEGREALDRVLFTARFQERTLDEVPLVPMPSVRAERRRP